MISAALIVIIKQTISIFNILEALSYKEVLVRALTVGQRAKWRVRSRGDNEAFQTNSASGDGKGDVSGVEFCLSRGAT
jgi:hypothetical protein